ncbi:hypothetical protein SKAU_G00086830 [Synaphobranchus kaupii]|uniref:Uncharacterized protein n=1 Tax=Synaphobranchus kaupii TaxID=118154 RepID=A0A9Q1J3V0_SYNKA|nr:hypothetical protein SKAU_G00086830 [Synaphobranchus kaupii]
MSENTSEYKPGAVTLPPVRPYVPIATPLRDYQSHPAVAPADFRVGAEWRKRGEEHPRLLLIVALADQTRGYSSLWSKEIQCPGTGMGRLWCANIGGDERSGFILSSSSPTANQRQFVNVALMSPLRRALSLPLQSSSRGFIVNAVRSAERPSCDVTGARTDTRAHTNARTISKNSRYRGAVQLYTR